METKVLIYVLVDPLTFKVRYIGRTREVLKKRLAEHISKSKLGYDKTHKANWIRFLIKHNSKPYIKKIAEVEGWEKSHKFERELISKYRDRLLNHDDRGEGGLQRIYTPEQKLKISETLKKYYKIHQIKTMTKIYVYNYDGTFYKEYPSIKAAAEDTGIYHGTITKHLTGISKVPNRVKMQFSYSKVDKMTDYTKK